MENQAELIREEMKDTRDDLSEKLETLEEKVTDSLSNAQHSVTETVETIKEGARESVESVRQALDVPRHVREHPWLMVGGAVLVGFMAHSLIVPRRSSRRTPAASVAPSGARSSVFGTSWQKLQRVAARTALDLVGRAARQSLPGELGSSIGNTVEEMSARLRDDLGVQPSSSPA